MMPDESNSPEIGPNIQREISTVKKMIELYCRKKHGLLAGNLCDDCHALLDYSTHRLVHCRFQEEKPTCRKCEVHCYNPAMREKIKQVMRFSGPRLLLRAPIIWFWHRIHDMDESS
jgi:NAD-dependent SIR2 family protein deacetylase